MQLKSLAVGFFAGLALAAVSLFIFVKMITDPY